MREEAAPEVIDSDGDDWHGIALQHFFDAASVHADFAIAGQFAFGEDGDDVAVGERRVHVFKGLAEERGVFAASGDGDGARAFEDVAQHGDTEDFVVHDEAQRTADGDHEDERIHVGDVVAGDDGRAATRDVVAATYAQAVAASDDEDDEAAHDEFRNDGEDVERDGEVHAEQERDERLQRPAEDAEDNDGEDAHQHEEEGVQDVVRRDHLRFVAAFGAVLDDGIERHGVDTTAEGNGEEGKCGVQEARVVQEGAEGVQFAEGGISADGDDTRHTSGENEGTNGDKPRLDPPARKEVAEERADADANGEQHQQVGGDFRAAIQHFFGVLRDLRQKRAAEQPEPGDGEDALVDGFLAVGVGEQGFGLLPGMERRQGAAVG